MGSSAHGITIINTDSTTAAYAPSQKIQGITSGNTSRTPPPLPNNEAFVQEQSKGEWLLPNGETESAGSAEQQNTMVEGQQSVLLNTNEVNSIESNNSPMRISENRIPENTSSTMVGASQNEKIWHLEPGSLYEQLTQWGVDDPQWDVTWVAEEDVEVDVPYRFVGQLDEIVIKVVESFAKQGVSIRILRAKANKQLVIKGD
jgi:hypothetical protein